MTPTQSARQDGLAEYIAAAIDAFCETYPDTDLDTIRRALQDAATDADVTHKEPAE